MDGTAKPRSPLLLLLGIALSGGVVLLLFLMNNGVPQRLIVLQRPFSPPLSIRERLDRNTLAQWRWVHAFENLILGSPKTINCAVFQLGQQNGMPFEEIVGAASAEDVTNGLQVWFLPAVSLNAIRIRIEADAHNTVYRPTITTPAATRAALGLMGQAVITNGVTSVPGLELLFLPRHSSQTTDLFANLVAFTTVTDDSRQGGRGIAYTRTNVDIAVRLQIPNGKGVLLVQGSPGNNKEYQAGFILDPL